MRTTKCKQDFLDGKRLLVNQNKISKDKINGGNFFFFAHIQEEGSWAVLSKWTLKRDNEAITMKRKMKKPVFNAFCVISKSWCKLLITGWLTCLNSG